MEFCQSEKVGTLKKKLFQNRVATHFGVTRLFSMRTVSLASSQSCRSIDADALCKQTIIFFTAWFKIPKILGKMCL